MIEYKPKVKNVYSELVKEYVNKSVTDALKVTTYSNKYISRSAITTIFPLRMTASRKNRNYNNSVITHYHDDNK